MPDGDNGLWALIREDFVAQGSGWTLPGWHAMVVYRIGVWARDRRGIGARLLHMAYRVVNSVLIRNFYGIELYDTTVVGRRLKIGHHMGVILGADAIIGDDVVVLHNVTIGKGREEDEGRPRIGNRVEIGTGAMILGSVVVGDDARIGPGAIVVKDVPAGAVAMASPARILKPAVPAESAGGADQADQETDTPT
ncbi:MAG: serine O-acetyltransferase [Acidimicrobiia bacterium]